MLKLKLLMDRLTTDRAGWTGFQSAFAMIAIGLSVLSVVIFALAVAGAGPFALFDPGDRVAGSVFFAGRFVIPALFYFAGVYYLTRGLKGASSLLGLAAWCFIAGGLLGTIGVIAAARLVGLLTSYVYADIPALALGVIGIVLLIVSRSLGQSLSARQELDEFI
ncbi:hypothetical protein [Altererythrobacter sp. ZODW24]|uniref:hypothetical protein n=1 Tax=Altererythrobacter sp. ZODW24 TaxID=2185142 RepID=UPI0013B35AA3|nr:hypothetical protein [Altererythrobacter sp. ZODW24]